MLSHTHAETSSITMHVGFPTPPEPTLGAPNLFIMNNILQYICKRAQTHKSTISKKGNLLYVAVDTALYTHYSAGKACPDADYSFPNAQFCWVQQWKRARCCKNHAHNPAQNAEQCRQHECCTYWHRTQPHPNRVQATLQARMYDESQHSLPPMFWLVCHQIRTHFRRSLQNQLDGNCPRLTPLNGLKVLTSCIFLVLHSHASQGPVTDGCVSISLEWLCM